MFEVSARLDAVLEQVRAGIGGQEAVCHPNGYRKILLREYPNGARLRLHHWKPGTGHEDPHDHRWAYTAVLLCGDISERVYRESEPGAESLRVYRYAADGGEATLEELGSTGLSIMSDGALVPGEFRHRPPDEIHSLSVGSAAMTVMLTAPPSRSWSRVFASDRRRDAQLRSLTLEELASSLTSASRRARGWL